MNAKQSWRLLSESSVKTVIDQKPGCFGQVVTYEPNSKTCKSCKHSSECDARVRDLLIGLESHFDVKDLKKRIGVKVKSKHSGSSSKVSNLIRSLEKRGVDVKESLAIGRNPLGDSDKPAFLREAFVVMIKSKSLNTKELSKHYRQVFPTWNDRTITNQASIATKLVESLEMDNK